MHFARNHPDWRLTGVDPSAAMLALAVQTLGPLADRAQLHPGYVHDAPPGPFDGASCILTLHFVSLAERLPTLQAIRARLKPGAPFICAHYSVPADSAERAQWFARFAAFAHRAGVARDKALAAAAKVATDLPILSPAQDEALLQQAGFGAVQQFYQSLTFRGWISTA